jgi:hypothetical protein
VAEKTLSKLGKAREEAANGVGQIISFGAMAAGQLPDAGAIGMHWPNISHEAAQIAETDEKMAGILDKLLEVGPYGNLIVVVLPFIAQILVNHGVLKPEQMAGANVVHPDSLAAQVRAHMARQAMDAIKMQQQAEADLAALQAEMMASQQASNGQAPDFIPPEFTRPEGDV